MLRLHLLPSRPDISGNSEFKKKVAGSYDKPSSVPGKVYHDHFLPFDDHSSRRLIT